MKTQFTDFWYSGKTPRSSRCSEKNRRNSQNLPKNRKQRNGNAENQFYPVCETDKEAYEYMRTSHMRSLR